MVSRAIFCSPCCQKKAPMQAFFPPIILLEYPFSGSLMGGSQMVVFFQVETPPEHIVLDNR